MADEETGSLTVTEALRLKHHLNQGITYGTSGLNAQQIRHLQEVEDWPTVRKEYNDYYPKMESIFARSWVQWGTIGAIIAMYYYLPGDWRWLTLALAIFMVYSVGKLQGHWEGYMAGYEDSHHRTVLEIAGVSPEEEKDLNERASEMEVDEGVLERLDKHDQKRPG